MKLKNKVFNLKVKDKKALDPNDCKWYTFKQGQIVPGELIEIAKLQGAELEEEVIEVVELVEKKEKVEKKKPVKKVVKKIVKKVSKKKAK